MGFWIFMLIMDLLIPITMIGFGKCFLKGAPKDINGIFGYRTTMSMKNKETWNYAHNYFGRIWYYGGVVMLPISVIVMILVFGKTEDSIGAVGGILCFIQTILLLASIAPTEKALKKRFDKNGNRR